MPTLFARAAALALATRVSFGVAEPSAEVGKCDFEIEPLFPGYFWDPSCQEGVAGCNADGKNLECRFCGGGNYSVPCPPSSCHFPSDPFVPYYWDATCEMGMLGCWADGVHPQCRFCGEHPFTGIDCPEELTAPPNSATCTFLQNEPTTPYFWDAGCKMGTHGCNADGIHVQCRFCGKGVYSDITCPASEVCSFGVEPTTPYYWDPDCAMGGLGCMADGLHAECRFCGKKPFEGIPCPGPIEPPKDQCTFPLHGEPQIGYYWDKNCTNGKLGCWADGMHAECRFCGSDVFQEIPCPNSTVAGSPAHSAGATGSGGGATPEMRYDAATLSRALMRKTSLEAVAKDISTTKASSQGEQTLLSGAAVVAPAFGALGSLLMLSATSSASSA